MLLASGTCLPYCTFTGVSSQAAFSAVNWCFRCGIVTGSELFCYSEVLDYVRYFCKQIDVSCIEKKSVCHGSSV